MIKFLKKHTFISISIFSLIILLIPIVLFLKHFGGKTISNDLSDWASFGDYVSGTINTILSLSSLILLGLLTSTISKQSNEENKKVNLLIKRLDSFEKLTDFLPKITQTLTDMAIDVTDITYALENKENDIDRLVQEFEKKTRFYTELQVFIQTFGLRYGHLYSYNFESDEFRSLAEDIVPTCDYFTAMTFQLKRRTHGYPAVPDDRFNHFLTTFGKVIDQLRSELY